MAVVIVSILNRDFLPVLFGLQVEHLCVLAAARYQLVVAARFDDSAVIEHIYPVGARESSTGGAR